MIDTREGLRLASQSRAELGIVEGVAMEQLDRDGAIDLGIVGGVDGRHRARSQPLGHDVAAEHRPGLDVDRATLVEGQGRRGADREGRRMALQLAQEAPAVRARIDVLLDRGLLCADQSMLDEVGRDRVGHAFHRVPRVVPGTPVLQGQKSDRTRHGSAV